jgi:hypothetical protein
MANFEDNPKPVDLMIRNPDFDIFKSEKPIIQTNNSVKGST